MALEDMVPACEDIDNAGFWSVECWGGATFDACIRFLNDDPWERLRTSVWTRNTEESSGTAQKCCLHIRQQRCRR
jgi:pyruvate/oxaloacetate carboxyltransferase